MHVWYESFVRLTNLPVRGVCLAGSVRALVFCELEVLFLVSKAFF